MRVGVWAVASAALGRPVTVAENPHVCGATITATVTGQPYQYRRRDCPACAVRDRGGGGRP